jgi:hypothetical protein
LNSLLIVFGISVLLLWHFYIVPFWGNFGGGHSVGAALGVVFGESIVYLISTLCGGVVYILSRSLTKKYPDRKWFRRQKYIGSAMAIVPLAALLLLWLSLLLF